MMGSAVVYGDFMVQPGGEIDNRFFDVNTTMRRLRKAFLFYTLLFVFLIIAVIGLIVSCFLYSSYSAAAAGIGICSLVIVMIAILFAVFFWFAWKAWTRYYNPNAIQHRSAPLSEKLFPDTKIYKQTGGPIFVKPTEQRVIVTPQSKLSLADGPTWPTKFTIAHFR